MTGDLDPLDWFCSGQNGGGLPRWVEWAFLALGVGIILYGIIYSVGHEAGWWGTP